MFYMPWAPSALSEVSFCTEIIDFLAWFVCFHFINSMFCRSLLNCNPKQKVWTVFVKAAMLGHTCFLWNEQEEKTWNHVWMKLMSFHLFKYLGRRQVMWWWNFVKVCLYKDMNAIMSLSVNSFLPLFHQISTILSNNFFFKFLSQK